MGNTLSRMEVRASATAFWGGTEPQPPGLGRYIVPMDDRPDGELLMIPVPIAAEITDGDWEIHFEVGYDPESNSLRIGRLEIVRRPDGPWIAPEMIRGVRLGEALKRAMRAVGHEVTRRGQVLRLGLSAEEVAPAIARRGRGRRMNEDDVKRAADAYRAAQESGRRDLVMAVAQALPASRSTAHRRIQDARHLGLLPEED